MWDVAVEALGLVFSPERLPFLLLGVFVGLVVGLIPGLSGAAGMSILLPFVFGMDPHTGIAMLVGMAAVVHTSDTFASVLLGIPGSSGSQATILDGYPMSKRGEGGRALSAAFIASMVGGVVGGIALLGVILIARPLILALGSPELFALAIFGLSMVVILSRGVAIAGAIAAALGLLLATIGVAPSSPEYRYTFDQVFLFDGLSIVIVALALFGIPEIVDMMNDQGSIAGGRKVRGGRMAGLRDVIRNRWLVLRNAILGVGFGAIPGIGGSVVDWLAYGINVQTTRGPSNYGKGDVRGVLAPESANNAKEGGALVPTLLFGIPGSVNTAILMGGLVLMGLQAGPSMIQEDLDVTLSVVWTLVVANILGASACLALSGYVARLTAIPGRILGPFLVAVLVFAAYQANARWGDVLVFLGLGILGLAMKRLGFPRPPLLIGFVLGPAIERYLWISMSRYGWEWTVRPGVVIILVFTVVVLAATLVNRRGTSHTKML